MNSASDKQLIRDALVVLQAANEQSKSGKVTQRTQARRENETKQREPFRGI